jgi:hypothetical protein
VLFLIVSPSAGRRYPGKGRPAGPTRNTVILLVPRPPYRQRNDAGRQHRYLDMPCAIAASLAISAMSLSRYSRWKAPILRHRDDLYLYSPRAAPYTETSIRARYHRWLKRTAEGKKLGTLWQKWVADQARKYEWDIDADDAANPTIHGLRGTGILLRYSLGYEVDQIANDIGMSRPMVERYMRFKDQMEVASSGGARPRLVEVKG